MRLRRFGKRSVPSYRIVVADKRFACNGRFIEEIGFYDPHGKSSVKFSEEKAISWLKKGAVPSDTVKSFLLKSGAWKKFLAVRKG